MKKTALILHSCFFIVSLLCRLAKLAGAHTGRRLHRDLDLGNDLDNLQWKTKVGVGFSSVVVADGRLFTMGHDGQKRGGKETVYCLNAKTGKPICGPIRMKPHWSIIYMKVAHVPPQQSMEMRSMPLASTVSSMPIRQVPAKKYGPRI